MSDCALIENCIFFNDRMANMPAMADLYKQRYCRSDHSVCARYRVFKALGRENVPSDMHPNEADRAAALIG